CGASRGAGELSGAKFRLPVRSLDVRPRGRFSLRFCVFLRGIREILTLERGNSNFFHWDVLNGKIAIYSATNLRRPASKVSGSFEGFFAIIFGVICLKNDLIDRTPRRPPRLRSRTTSCSIITR